MGDVDVTSHGRVLDQNIRPDKQAEQEGLFVLLEFAFFDACRHFLIKNPLKVINQGLLLGELPPFQQFTNVSDQGSLGPGAQLQALFGVVGEEPLLGKVVHFEEEVDEQHADPESIRAEKITHFIN